HGVGQDARRGAGRRTLPRTVLRPRPDGRRPSRNADRGHLRCPQRGGVSVAGEGPPPTSPEAGSGGRARRRGRDRRRYLGVDLRPGDDRLSRGAIRDDLEPHRPPARPPADGRAHEVGCGGAVRAPAVTIRAGGASGRCKPRARRHRRRGDEALVRLILDSSSGSYPVVIGSNLQRELRNVITRLEPTGAAIITDRNVRPWALKVAKAIKRVGLKTPIHVIPASERSKSMAQLEEVLSFLERRQI